MDVYRYVSPYKKGLRMKSRLVSWTLAALVMATLGPAAAAEPPQKRVVGIALPRAQLGQGNSGGTTDVAEPVRQALMKYLAGPALDVVVLDARIPIQIAAEAKQKNVAFVIYSDVTQKRGGSMGGFLKKMAPLASAMPMLGGMSGGRGMDAAGAMIAQQVAATASQVAMQSAQQDAIAAMTGAQQSNVKRGDTITLEYLVTDVGAGTSSNKVSLQGKAKEDGEDLLSPLLEQLATQVLTSVNAP
jgi:hypothetical protein